MYRSRGIWVDPVYRGKGVAGILFCELEGQAMKEQCKSIWSVPREKALPSYVKYGFKQTSDFFNEGMEFGPNCYVIKELDYELKQH
jgi:GNAT superfamily N-acetyltransferase